MNKSQELEIIIVEDNDADAELTLRALKKNNLSNHIIRLTDGQEVIDYLLNPDNDLAEMTYNNPKLILLDLKLPKMSGVEVLTILKSDQRTKKIPIVVLTSTTEETDIEECYRLGVNSYIVKPVEFDKFMESVQKLGLYWLLLNQYPQN